MTNRPQPSLTTRARRVGYIVGVTLALVVLVAGVVGWYESGHRRADVSTWLGATIAVLGVMGVVAFVASLALTRAVAQGHKDRHEKAAKVMLAVREDRGPAPREQASLVAAWFVQDPAAGGGLPRVVLRNASQVPVARARIIVHRGSEVLGHQDVGLLPPNLEPEPVDLPTDLVQKISDIRASGEESDAWQPEIDVFFFDAAGVAWWRTSAGLLKEMRKTNSPSEAWEERPEWAVVAVVADGQRKAPGSDQGPEPSPPE